MIETLTNQLAVANSTRSASGDKASSAAINVVRCILDSRPCSTNGSGICPVNAARIASRCSVRSVSTNTGVPFCVDPVCRHRVAILASNDATIRAW